MINPQIPHPLSTMKEGVLESIIEKVPFGFSLINADYVLESANDAWLKIIEKSGDEVIGKIVFEVFPEMQEALKPILETIKQTKEPFYSPEYSWKLMRKGALETVFFNFVYQPIFSDSDQFQHFACVAIEVTDVVETKNKIKNEEERLRLATESSQTATWDLNLKNSDIIHSSYLAKIFGYDEGDILGHQQMKEHLVEYDRINIVDKAYERALKTGKYKYEARIIDKQGNLKWIHTNGKIFRDEENQPSRMLGVMQDITERKKNEILLQESHHQLNTALDATKLGRFDMDYITQEKYNFSARFLSILGYDAEKEKIDGKIFEKHIHPKYLAVRNEALKKAKITGDLYYQTEVILRDGKVKWVEIYGRLLESFEGSKSYVSGTMRDITELKEFEQKIKESEQKYRFLADSIPQIVWIAESDGRMTYFNQATMDYSGKDYNAFLEYNGWIDIVHPNEREENIQKWMVSVMHKTPFVFEHRFRNKNDEYRWFLSRAAPQLDDFGTVTKWVGTSTDIDDMKKQDEHKNNFIKIANHELKTPVTTIKGYVQLLKKMRGDSDDKFLVNSLNTIENQINKLNLLMGELLDISRIESGKLPLYKGYFSLLKLVTETIEDIKASDQSHKINFELSGANDIEVFADKDRITQVLNNLLTNAIKYSPTSKEVNVKLFVDGDCAVVSVEDFGIGMDEPELNKIFERFYRVSGEDEVTFPGFGIGLFIVKDIIERHDGNIWVESEKQKGSKFYFSLPLVEK